MAQSSTNSLAGKVALVTGAARRIGAEIADLLHEHGANVAIHYRSSATEALALCARLNERRAGSANTFKCDLAETGAAATLVDAVATWAGGLHIVVNNASTFYPTPLGSITEDTWADLVDSNLKAPLFVSQAAVPYLRKNRGVIVNIVDIHAKKPLKDHAVYGAAKAGLAMLTRSLARDLAPDVRVNGVSPGAIMWPERGMTGEIKRQIIDEIPLGRAGDASDIANAVLFLVCDATYTTGQIIAIDGGRSAGW